MAKRILLLADINSAHLLRWANSLLAQGNDVAVFTLSEVKIDLPPPFKVFNGARLSNDTFLAKVIFKLSYLKALPALKAAIKSFSPDVVHAHYASSYGLLGALIGFKPYFISVWGSDVYLFPKLGVLQKKILMYNLSCATKIFATSQALAIETQKYTQQSIEVIPFGIATTIFFPVPKVDSETIVISHLKSLEKVYGQELLIRAFKILVSNNPCLKFKLVIVGDGSLRESLSNLCIELGLAKQVVFTGAVNYLEVSSYHQMSHFEVYPSYSESFGVAALEAAACGKPVVASNVGGLPEVVIHGVTGLLVNPGNLNELYEAMQKLSLDPELVAKMGNAAQKHAASKFNWDVNVAQMNSAYNIF